MYLSYEQCLKIDESARANARVDYRFFRLQEERVNRSDIFKNSAFSHGLIALFVADCYNETNRNIIIAHSNQAKVLAAILIKWTNGQLMTPSRQTALGEQRQYAEVLALPLSLLIPPLDSYKV